MWSSTSPAQSPRALPRRAATFFNRVKEVDASLLEVRNKLSSELHNIFHIHSASSSNISIGLPPHATSLSLDIEQPALDLRSPLLPQFSPSPPSRRTSDDQTPSSTVWSSSLQSTPLLATSPTSLASPESLFLDLHSESACDEEDVSTVVPSIPDCDFDDKEDFEVETISDPFNIAARSLPYEDAERVDLRDASARAAFGLPPRPLFRHRSDIRMKSTRASSLDQELVLGAPIRKFSKDFDREWSRRPSLPSSSLRPSKSLVLRRPKSDTVGFSATPKARTVLSSQRQSPFHGASGSLICPPPLPPLPHRRQTAR